MNVACVLLLTFLTSLKLNVSIPPAYFHDVSLNFYPFHPNLNILCHLPSITIDFFSFTFTYLTNEFSSPPLYSLSTYSFELQLSFSPLPLFFFSYPILSFTRNPFQSLYFSSFLFFPLSYFYLFLVFFLLFTHFFSGYFVSLFLT